MIDKKLIFWGIIISMLYTELQAQKPNYPVGFAELAPLSQEDSINLANLPVLTLPEWLKDGTLTLPSVVDNSANMFWRPVFAQVGLECGQAASVGLGFTYEVNRLRNLPSNVPENQYATHFTWNFGNGGDGWFGVSYFHSFEILRTLGNPNVITYGGMSYGGGSRWMSGYDSYYESMKNRIYEVYQIDVSSEEGITTARNWLHNHLEGAGVGGVANFYANAPYGMSTLPPGTPEAGKYVVTSWSYANHALTISGYHDSIRWDYNNDGLFTNNIDINNDGVVNVRDWEIGGFRFANTYSGGPSFGNNGFSYMTYKSCADPYGNGGIWNNALHVIYAKEYTSPLLTARISIKDNCRETIRVRVGVTTDVSSVNPQFTLGFPIINFQGSCKYMQGGTNEADKTIEFGLDLTPLINFVGPGIPARYFLLVDEEDPNSWYQGEIVQFSVIDYTNGMNEIDCGQVNVAILDNATTKLWVDHTVNFNEVTIITDTLPPATVFEPYSAQVEASGGMSPYIWDFDKNFTETNYTSTFPVVTSQQLYPGNSYTTKTLGFSFPFYDQEFSTVRIYTDGYIMFENEFTWPYQVYDFLKFTKNKYIAPFMADLVLNFSDNDGVWYEGDNNQATFRWKASVNGDPLSDLNFAVRLFKNGDIRFYYGMNLFMDLEWISGISAGDNKYYQFTRVNGQPSLPVNYVCDLQAPTFPPGFNLTHDGTIQGMPDNTYDNFAIKIMATDENNLKASGLVYLSTDGSNYLVISSNSVVAGDDNVIEVGETVNLSVSVKNLGETVISGVNMKISCDNEWITLTDSTEYLGNFNPGEIKTFGDAFVFDVSNQMPNGYNIDLNTLIYDNTGEDWQSHIYLTAYAPELFLGNVTINDGGNGCLDPGETAELMVKILNGGGATALDIYATLSTEDPLITLNNPACSLVQIPPYSFTTLNFTITADENTPIGHVVEFTVSYNVSNSTSGSGEFQIIVGQTPVLIVDLDDNSSSAPYLETALGNLGVSYEILNGFPPDLNLYSSIFVCLGIYSANYVLTQNEGQDLADYLNNGGNLYMEGGDTWAYDAQTPVHPLFSILGEADGTNDLGNVQGQEDTFTEGMQFYYSGENNWIDHISPLNDAYLIFENQTPEYGVAVANDAGTYRTIGASFEFGGLADAAPPSTKEDLMAQYLEFFGVLSFDLIANFVANQTQVCAGDSVHFTDYSVGNITSWSWEFEGAVPSTSTLKNPVVFYPQAGTFDVSLIIANGLTSDTITKQNYIVVFPNPGIPATPTGENTVCTNLVSASVYTTAGAPFADAYVWELTPEESGTINGNGVAATVTWTPSWVGTASVRVKSVNAQCGESEFSQYFTTDCMLCTGMNNPSVLNNIRIYPNPAREFLTIETGHFGDEPTIIFLNTLNEVIPGVRVHPVGEGIYRARLYGLTEGVYFIRIRMGGREVIKKLFVQ